MFSMLLPLAASEARRARRPNLPPSDDTPNLLQRWLRAVRIAFGRSRD